MQLWERRDVGGISVFRNTCISLTSGFYSSLASLPVLPMGRHPSPPRHHPELLTFLQQLTHACNPSCHHSTSSVRSSPKRRSSISGYSNSREEFNAPGQCVAALIFHLAPLFLRGYMDPLLVPNFSFSSPTMISCGRYNNFGDKQQAPAALFSSSEPSGA